ncbi:FeoB-associated Cys-rich membrane protein [Fibrella aquatilis]|uniref:FeoB-associated Cys-rich membrane protein n=1 Tax=Fibrella aquatilis TaxID=2817059 RepID=A0A939JW76_9BACT|nr:FeoB-associated Cys-rich membrane protein [Fibrella aquatilis]MBO0931612.1 FeoB-associated Cys-rich membrane protein [Fibrella aquatilis]
MQTLLIFVLFVAALGYLGWRGYRAMAAKQAGCGKGCGCAADKTQSFNKI